MLSKIKILAKCNVLSFVPIAYFRQNNKKILTTKDTDIVIEGFWRCANHYAVFAFKNAEKNTNIAHHFHASAQIKIAIKKNIPSLVLIRNPFDCIASCLVFEPNTKPQYFIEYYKQFYISLMDLRHNFIISDFDETITNFGDVMKKINKKFIRNFRIFDNSKENINKVFKEIKDDNLMSMTKDIRREIALPSEEKKHKKLKMIKMLNDSYFEEMKELIEIYEKFKSK